MCQGLAGLRNLHAAKITHIALTQASPCEALAIGLARLRLRIRHARGGRGTHH